MIIENPDALKQWLTGYLPPLCDADPEVLAKYCLALVKKDRSHSELKASMIEQLDVFLKTNTETFVEKFLQVAKSKSYISKSIATPVVTPVTDTLPPDEIVSLSAAGHSPDSTTCVAITTTTIGTTPCNNSTTTTNSPSQPPLPPLPPPIVSIPHPPPETTPPYPPPPPPPKKDEVVTSTIKSRKTDLDRDREDRRGRRRSRSRAHTRSRSRDKTRSRSRERERNRRSRSRGRAARVKYEDRRRRSPHSKRYVRRSRTRSRSPKWSRSPNRRSRSRNRTRSVSPKRHQSRHKTRSRSPKTAAAAAAAAASATSPISSTKKSPKRGEEKERSTSPDAGNDNKGPTAILQSVVSVPVNQERYTTTKSQRCRDYDEQGFCMRGDQCPFDHGADPVVLEGGALDFPPPLAGVPLPTVTGGNYLVPGPSMPQDLSGRPFMRHPPPSRPPSQFGEYTPNDPGLWGGDTLPSNPYFGGRGRGMGAPPPRFSGPPPPLLPLDMGRELISVPVNGANQGKPGIRSSLAQRLGPAANATFAPNGAGFVGSHSVKFPVINDNCTLELRKVPMGMNTISHLNQHFSKFGTIINIQVHHEGDPEAALVTFSSHSEANAAYRSTEAVLNNRFIKLFWHNGTKADVPSTTTSAQRSVHERLGTRHPNKSLNNKLPALESEPSESNDKVILKRGSLIKTVYNPSAIQNNAQISEEPSTPTLGAPPVTTDKVQVKSPVAGSNFTFPVAGQPQKPKHLTTVEMKKQEIEAIHKQQDLLRAEIDAKHKVEKQKADAIKLKNEVELRTRQLLKEQMQHVKLLINKLEKNRSTMKSEEIKTLMNTIKSLQSAVETTKSQLLTSAAVAVSASQLKTKQQLDKEILDTELELYTIQSEGGDITRLRIRLQQLRNQAIQLRGNKHHKTYSVHNVVPKSVVMGRGRGIIRGGRGRGRGKVYGGVFNAVDRRSSSINASGFEREDKAEVLAHFASLGSVSNYSWDDQTPAITVQFSARREAEKAMSEGRTLGDRLLTLTWASETTTFNTNALPSAPGMPSTTLHQRSPTFISSVTPHSTSVISHEDGEEITEEIVEEVETEEGGSYIFEDEMDEEENEGRSWRR